VKSLDDLTTRELLDYLRRSRKNGAFYSPYDNGVGYSSDQIKKVLATREHIPNKAEAKKERQDEAWSKKHR
jgi:hypothetical protein